MYNQLKFNIKLESIKRVNKCVITVNELWQEQEHDIMHRLQLDWNVELQYHFKTL